MTVLTADLGSIGTTRIKPVMRVWPIVRPVILRPLVRLVMKNIRLWMIPVWIRIVLMDNGSINPTTPAKTVPQAAQNATTAPPARYAQIPPHAAQVPSPTQPTELATTAQPPVAWLVPRPSALPVSPDSPSTIPTKTAPPLPITTALVTWITVPACPVMKAVTSARRMEAARSVILRLIGLLIRITVRPSVMLSALTEWMDVSSATRLLVQMTALRVATSTTSTGSREGVRGRLRRRSVRLVPSMTRQDFISLTRHLRSA